ncbi:DUF2141 domain-containing protein [Ruegeria sp. R14_0]|uniref:DUF2141 domain-containing protein n=1 Tax=Ruegeria sp. R14_0 TaxID=2821100 RepID=UPI001ADB51A0|nr:DUF2141 domain-containing protein [Ruegeria sp. R14_0]MBO9446901.1 DUF2141 domain-containing protein [Ruegeria sp. R14_0]
MTKTAFFAGIMALVASQAAAGDIQVDISGVEAGRGGVIHVLAFDDKTAFDQSQMAKIVGYAKIPASGSSVSGTLKNQNPGSLAIMVHHDENDNGQFEMKGPVPQEGWAYSKGAGARSVPVFEDVAIDYDGNNSSVGLKMNYAN